MADLMDEQKRYLNARLKECEKSPQLNAFQIAEYKKYLDMLASSKDADEYADKIAFSGDMFSVSQAEQLDRYDNFKKIHKMFGDEKSIAADTMRFDAAKNASSHMDLYEKMTAVTEKASETIQISRRAVENIKTLFTLLVVYRTCCEKSKGAKRGEVAGCWNLLTQIDPDISWEKMLSYTPYRSVLIFNDARLMTMKSWFDEAVK